MAATQTEYYVQLKLLVDEKRNKVIFAEAGKDFVDALFSFLTLPLGTITRLVQKESKMGPVTFGCMNKLYKSVADLDKDCMKTGIDKKMLLQPVDSFEDYCSSLKLNIDDTKHIEFYICSRSCFPCEYSDVLNTSNTCVDCWIRKTPVVSLEKQFGDGFVKDGATFVITDDLRVLPNSMDMTSFSKLQNFGIDHTSSVKEMIVNVTKEKVLDLLKCSLVSRFTLTDLFLGIKPPHGWLSRVLYCDVENTINIQMAVKLVIRKSDGKILYAEGGSDFADFLISFLILPLGGVVRMFGGNCSVGNIDALYQSIFDLDEKKYFVTKEAKNRIVDPHLAPQFKSTKRILPIREPRLSFYCHDNDYITCENRDYFEDISTRKPVFVECVYGSYVKGPRTYVVTDDLGVTESSPTSVLNIINHFRTLLNGLQEKVINIGGNECLSILKASLTSTSALTNGLGHLVTEVQEGKMRSINIC